LLPLIALAKPPVPVDGPYVRYTGGQVIVTTIERDDDLLEPQTQTFPLSAKAAITLQVTPEGHPDWSFTVRLKPNLEPEPSTFAAPTKTLFLSDIEGEFAKFREILLAAKIIDTQYNWTYDRGSVVIAGDLFDRGTDVVPELWLLYKLEDEAKVAGGAVHVLLGNHDVMNLSGDNRYTDAKYFKNAWLMEMNISHLFDKSTELGRWLRSRNVIEKVGDILVMHGGLSPALLAVNRSPDQLNAACRPFYAVSTEAVPDSLKVYFGSKALFWYRGYFRAPKISEADLDITLKQYDCKQILVGHTIVKWNIALFLGGKVIGVDVDYHKGKPMAALYQDGQWLVIDEKGKCKPMHYQPTNDQIKESDIL